MLQSNYSRKLCYTQIKSVEIYFADYRAYAPLELARLTIQLEQRKLPMTKNHAVFFILILVLFALPFAAMAQEGEIAPADEVALFAIPPILLGLMTLNNRSTEALKLYLASAKLPFTPPADVRSLLVLLFSIVFGMASAAVTPTALDWLGASFNPIAAVVVTGFVVSLGAAAFQMVMSLLAGLGNKSVYSTTTTISAPPADSAAPKEAMAAVSAQVAKG